MTGLGSALWRRVFQGYLYLMWTFVSPVMISGILVFYVYDVVNVHRPYYNKWDNSTGTWDKDENGTVIKYEYPVSGKTAIWLLHLFVLIWFPIFFVKSFYKGNVTFQQSIITAIT